MHPRTDSLIRVDALHLSQQYFSHCQTFSSLEAVLSIMIKCLPQEQNIPPIVGLVPETTGSLKSGRPLDKSAYLKIIFLIPQPKHMLWVLKRTVLMRRFF